MSLVAPGPCSAQNGGANPCYIDSATALPASTTPYTVTISYPGDVNFIPASTTVPLFGLSRHHLDQPDRVAHRRSYGNEGSVNISATVTSGTSGAPSGPVAVQDGGSTVCTINHLSQVGPNASTGSCPHSATQSCPRAPTRSPPTIPVTATSKAPSPLHSSSPSQSVRATGK